MEEEKERVEFFSLPLSFSFRHSQSAPFERGDRQSTHERPFSFDGSRQEIWKRKGTSPYDAPKGRAFGAIIANAAEGEEGETLLLLLCANATAAAPLLLAARGTAPLACWASVERILMEREKREKREEEAEWSWPLE